MKRTRIKGRSPSRADEDDERRQIREAMFAADPFCELRQACCTGTMQGLHERRKRSSAGSVVNRANLMRACNACNGWVEDNPDEAHALGFVFREGDDGWGAVSRRHDRFR